MKTKITLLILFSFSLVFFDGCSKKEAAPVPVVYVYGCTDPLSSTYNPAANKDDGSCKYTGPATFWYNSNIPSATVVINNQVGYITKYYPDYNPTCGSDGCANFTIPIGTYSFHATSQSLTWDGTITITTNHCSPMLLKKS